MTETIHPQDQAQAHAIIQAREAKDEAVREINAAFARMEERNKAGTQLLVDQVNEARAIGLHLIGLKKASKRDFGTLFTSDSGRANQNPVFGFTAEYGRVFMRLAEKLPDPIISLPEHAKSLKDVLVLMEALPASARGDQSARGTMNWLSTLQRQGMTMLAIVGKEEEKLDLREWPRTQVQALVDQLKPFNEKYEAALAVLGGGAA